MRQRHMSKSQQISDTKEAAQPIKRRTKWRNKKNVRLETNNCGHPAEDHGYKLKRKRRRGTHCTTRQADLHKGNGFFDTNICGYLTSRPSRRLPLSRGHSGNVRSMRTPELVEENMKPGHVEKRKRKRGWDIVMATRDGSGVQQANLLPDDSAISFGGGRRKQSVSQRRPLLPVNKRACAGVLVVEETSKYRIA